MNAPVLDFFAWPRSRVLPETPIDVRGRTPERRAQIENIALTAMAAVKETGHV